MIHMSNGKFLLNPCGWIGSQWLKSHIIIWSCPHHSRDTLWRSRHGNSTSHTFEIWHLLKAKKLYCWMMGPQVKEEDNCSAMEKVVERRIWESTELRMGGWSCEHFALGRKQDHFMASSMSFWKFYLYLSFQRQPWEEKVRMQRNWIEDHIVSDKGDISVTNYILIFLE